MAGKRSSDFTLEPAYKRHRMSAALSHNEPTSEFKNEHQEHKIPGSNPPKNGSENPKTLAADGMLALKDQLISHHCRSTKDASNDSGILQKLAQLSAQNSNFDQTPLNIASAKLDLSKQKIIQSTTQVEEPIDLMNLIGLNSQDSDFDFEASEDSKEARFKKLSKKEDYSGLDETEKKRAQNRKSAAKCKLKKKLVCKKHVEKFKLLQIDNIKLKKEVDKLQVVVTQIDDNLAKMNAQIQETLDLNTLLMQRLLTDTQKHHSQPVTVHQPRATTYPKFPVASTVSERPKTFGMVMNQVNAPAKPASAFQDLARLLAARQQLTAQPNLNLM